MAIYWKAKAPASVAEYIWTPNPDESVASAVITVTTGTATLVTETDGPEVTVTVTGGVVGVVQALSATITLDNGEVISETIYLPIIASTNALGNTGQDIAAYILRKVSGIGETADADEVEDCLERVSDMLATWRLQGADIGVVLPLTTSTVFLCEDAYIQAIKANGILACADLYGFEVSPVVIEQARRGLGTIKTSLLSAERGAAEYY